MQTLFEDKSKVEKTDEEKAEENEKGRYWVNFLGAVFVTFMVIIAMDSFLIPEEYNRDIKISRYISGALALQLFPLFFGWIARKINFSKKYWEGIYWLTLIIVLIIRGITMINLASN